MSAFLYVKSNSKEIREEVSFSFFRKTLMSAFLFRLMANYLKKLATPIFLRVFQ